MSEKNNLEKVLEFAVRKGASDIHFRVGEPPGLRIRGELLSIGVPPLNKQSIEAICKSLMSSSAIEIELSQVREVDGSFDLGDLGRFRFNVFRHDGCLGAVLRVIPSIIPTLDDLKFPDVIKKIASIERGLILVTGATGQGKSTTIAAMVDYLNATRRSHIITIEDPIEFVHRPKQCKITQREVGRDTKSFSDALRSALRQDPNIILVGELRDPESIDMALKASETGHTVLSTLHTTDAAKSIGRIISMFPPEEQGLVRLRLADCLKASVSQRLLARADGKGRVVGQEIMITNTAIAECIADPKRTAEIPTFIANGQSLLGSQTFNQALSHLYRTGIITLEVAKQASANASDFEHALNYEKNENATMTSSAESGQEGEDEDSDSSAMVELETNGIRMVKSATGSIVPEIPDGKNGFLGKVMRSVKKA